MDFIWVWFVDIISITHRKVLGQERMEVHDVHAMLAAKWFVQQDGSRKKTVDAQTSFFFACSKNGARTTYAWKSAIPAQSQNVASMSPVESCGFGNLSRV